MASWALLLRAVNLGPRNKLKMADLRALLTDLGHADVKTYLNSGNATFTSSKRSAKALAAEVEKGLLRELDLDVRACVRSLEQVQAAVDGVPKELTGYVVVTVLFDKPKPAALKDVLERDWSPEQVRGNDQVLYLSFTPGGVHSSKLQNATLEKLLGVSCTARTPATLRKMLA
ncbi:MAG: hypothetical protein QOE05_2156 [Actinomycetota bacterium]|jgi:uncharacterized protein (DUF1697 family)|nr:hypothetical protein [Actinomycetota bacterium]